MTIDRYYLISYRTIVSIAHFHPHGKSPCVHAVLPLWSPANNCVSGAVASLEATCVGGGVRGAVVTRRPHCRGIPYPTSSLKEGSK